MYALALVGYSAIAPALSAAYSGAPSVGIVVIRAYVLVVALVVLVFAKNNTTKILLIWLVPYLVFRLAFFFRFVDNTLLQGLDLYVATSIAYIVILGYGFIPSIAVAKVAPRIAVYEFRSVMNMLSIIFCVGVLLNANVLFGSALSRVSVESLNAISLTSVAATFLLYSFVFFEKNRNTVLLLAFVVPICLAVVAVSKSRGPIAAAVITILFYFLASSGAGRRSVLVASVLLVPIVAMSNFVFNTNILTELASRFFFSSGYDAALDLSGNARELIWSRSWSQFLENPVFGRYIFEYVSGGYPHNLFIEVLISLGIVGAFLFGWFLVVSFRAATSLVREAPGSRIGVFSSLLFVKSLGEGLFSGNLVGSPSLWITSCFIVSLHLHRRAREQMNIATSSRSRVR